MTDRTLNSVSTSTTMRMSSNQNLDSTSSSSSLSNDSTNIFALKKKRDGCTGMFWRKDPTNRIVLESNDHWPRDGALLRGNIRIHEGSSWLAATHVKNRNDKDWVQAPKGAHLPMEYDNHYYLERLEEGNGRKND
jgi:hypothetical protein